MAVRTATRPSSKSRQSSHPLFRKAEQGFVTALDAVRNLEEFLNNSSGLALIAVKDSERDLDQLERQIDDQLPKAIARADESMARDLIASLRFISDLERISDLCAWVAARISTSAANLSSRERARLRAMAEVLHSMLKRVHEGLLEEEQSYAEEVLRTDLKMDQLRQEVFQDFFAGGCSTDLLLIAQAFERAGDHVTNLAEELFRWVDGRSIRHRPKRKLER